MLTFDRILKIKAWRIRHDFCNFDLYMMNVSRSLLILLWSVLILNYLTNISKLNENNTKYKYIHIFEDPKEMVIKYIYLDKT